MKILTSSQIRAVDDYTIEHEPIASIDLMERAAMKCADWIIDHFDISRKIAIFIGPGNNGGDGLAIARILNLVRYNLSLYMLTESDKLSPDALVNYNRLEDIIPVVLNESSFPQLDSSVVIIDALFGTGLSRPLDGMAAKTVACINNSGCTVVSVDIPSGLFCNDNSENICESIVRATYCLTFQLPKLSFFFAENAAFTGKWEVLDIGLSPEGIDAQETRYSVLQRQDIAANILPRDKFAHKGNFGHACLIAGSYGMMGAAVLAAKACLRAGAGLLTAHIPKDENIIMQVSLPEAIISFDENSKIISSIPKLDNYSAIGIGPGIGTKPETQQALYHLLQEIISHKSVFSGKLVFDADALNILSENSDWLNILPANSILTPHPKEFDRLAGISDGGYSRHLKQIEMARRYSVILVLKGAHTTIATPDGQCFFNTTGNPGMATAGSGDLLTGMITSLLAQGLQPLQAACTGVWLHGASGDIAAAKKGQQALIASDIIENIGEVFKI